MNLRLITLFALTLTALSVSAEARVVQSGCEQKETATLNINFNGTGDTVKEIRGLFDDRMEKIKQYAKQAGVKEVTLQSQNYSISTQNNYNAASVYRYNGNASFKLSPSDKAADMMELLTKNHIQSSLNVNMYKSGSCQ